MSDWQERITHETSPAIRAEHELRYRTVAPLILSGGLWADLGCGSGVAAAAALGEGRPAHTVLVDIDAEVVAGAALELALPEATQLAGDLTDPATLERIGEALTEHGERALVSCFEVIEHLASFLPLLEFSSALAREHGATFVISVPNDAFWAIKNPYHLASWGEGAFEELRALLPAEHTLMRQVALTGSALIDWEATPERHPTTAEVGGQSAVATHFIAAFGPRHAELQRSAIAAQTDQLEQRRWERQRENDAEVYRHAVAAHREAIAAQDRAIATQAEELRAQTVQFDEWRAYIHELERELGRPPSGSAPARSENPPAAADTQTAPGDSESISPAP